jgi:hypothetical protein
MNKRLVLSIVILVVATVIAGAIYNHVAKNGKPDSALSVVKDIHDSVAPDGHKPSAR